jgi:hypothetical protein
VTSGDVALSRIVGLHVTASVGFADAQRGEIAWCEAGRVRSPTCTSRAETSGLRCIG